jgi:hypothetical protein
MKFSAGAGRAGPSLINLTIDLPDQPARQTYPINPP